MLRQLILGHSSSSLHDSVIFFCVSSLFPRSISTFRFRLSIVPGRWHESWQLSQPTTTKKLNRKTRSQSRKLMLWRRMKLKAEALAYVTRISSFTPQSTRHLGVRLLHNWTRASVLVAHSTFNWEHKATKLGPKQPPSSNFADWGFFFLF